MEVIEQLMVCWPVLEILLPQKAIHGGKNTLNTSHKCVLNLRYLFG